MKALHLCWALTNPSTSGSSMSYTFWRKVRVPSCKSLHVYSLGPSISSPSTPSASPSCNTSFTSALFYLLSCPVLASSSFVNQLACAH